jgi:hypothetical protein
MCFSLFDNFNTNIVELKNKHRTKLMFTYYLPLIDCSKSIIIHFTNPLGSLNLGG